MFFQLLQSVAAAPTMPLIWSMYADAADYSEYRTGRRATGLVFSAVVLGQKAGIDPGWRYSSLAARQRKLWPREHRLARGHPKHSLLHGLGARCYRLAYGSSFGILSIEQCGNGRDPGRTGQTQERREW
ncbi:MAG: hypothetical protein HC842_06350 [Cytophagales bacterium]|nr:hypothetical protein [Cytophagales bacterium]